MFFSDFAELLVKNQQFLVFQQTTNNMDCITTIFRIQAPTPIVSTQFFLREEWRRGETRKINNEKMGHK
jgi:hypothetical protein